MRKKIFFNRVSLIAKNEFRESFRDGRFLFISFSLLFILGITFWFGYNYYKTTFEDRTTSQNKVWESWVSQNDKNPHMAGHYGTYAFKPVTPFNIVEKGLNPYVGQTIRIETHKQNPTQIREAEDSTFLLRQGELTIGFILQIFIPLLIIVLAHSSITKEKEQETIRLAFCQGISNLELVLGKLLGVIGILAIIMIPFILVMIGFITYQGYDTNLVYSLGVFIISYILYFSIFLFLSIGVSAYSSTSRQALLLLFSVWVITCIVMPKISSFISEEVYKTPSAYDFTEDIENETFQASYKGVQHWQDLNQKVKEDLLEEYNVSSLDSVPVNVFGYTLKVLEEEGHAAYERNYNKMDSIFKLQNKVYDYTSILSPLIDVRFISMAIASSNNQEQTHFINFSEKYRRQMMNVLNDDIMKNQHNRENKDYIKGKDLWKQIPEYIYEKRSFKQVFADYQRNFFILLGWFILSILFLFFSIKYIRK